MAAEGRQSAINILDDSPELWPWLNPIIEGFYCLHGSRDMHVGMNGAIPAPLAFSEIVAYYNAFRPAFDLADFIKLVQSADRAWLAAPRPQPPKKPRPAPAPTIWTPGRR